MSHAAIVAADVDEVATRFSTKITVTNFSGPNSIKDDTEEVYAARLSVLRTLLEDLDLPNLVVENETLNGLSLSFNASSTSVKDLETLKALLWERFIDKNPLVERSGPKAGDMYHTPLQEIMSHEAA